MSKVLDSVKDEPAVLKRLSKKIVKYANMDEQEFKEQKKFVDSKLQKTDAERRLVIDLYNIKDWSNIFDISDDGTIRLARTNNFIEDENLKEKIFAQLYFQGKQEEKSKFEEKVKDFYSNGQTNFKFNETLRTPADRKKFFSAMKVTAREQGYAVLNSLDECDSGENIEIRAIRVQKGKKVDFKDLKNIYQKLDIFYKNDDYTHICVKDRRTGKEITDPQLATLGKFATLWGTAAGTKWMADEEIRGITYAFDDSSKRVFNELGGIIEKSMAEKGEIDTKSIYESISGDMYKHSEEIIRTLLSNPAKTKIVYDFYRMQCGDARLETKLPVPAQEFIYGVTDKDLVDCETEKIIQSLPESMSHQKIEESLSRDEIRGEYTDREIDGNEIQIVQNNLKKEINDRKEMEQLAQAGENLTAEQQQRFTQLKQTYKTNQAEQNHGIGR